MVKHKNYLVRVREGTWFGSKLLLRLGDPCPHGYNKKHLVTVRLGSTVGREQETFGTC